MNKSDTSKIDPKILLANERETSTNIKSCLIAPNILSANEGETNTNIGGSKIEWNKLQYLLPDPVWRARWDDLAEKYGLPFKRSYMQNLDSEGKGPEKTYMRKRVAYPLPGLITWLNSL